MTRPDKLLRPFPVVLVLMVVVIAGTGCSPLGVLNTLTPTDTYIVTRDLEYGADPREKLDVYQPRPVTDKQAPRKTYPVVVFFHGGTWVSGDRSDYKFIGEALASQGIVTMVANYRLYPQVRYPDFLEDCAKAVVWAQREAARYGGDARRLYVMGHSSGAYNAAMLALDPRWLKAAGLSPSALAGWIGLAGPYDFFPIRNPDAQPVFNHPDYPAGSQPIAYASRTSPRTFLGAAGSDDLVDPDRNTRQLAEKLRAAGVAVTQKIYPDVNHYTLIAAFSYPLRSLDPVLKDVSLFVNGSDMMQ